MSDSKENAGQTEAIRFHEGPALILAGPGSGKTFVTVERIRRLITHHKADPAKILVITFTKAAALEMQERFHKLMEPIRPPVRFGTFHAVFYHILKQSAQYRAYTIITEGEKRKLLRKISSIHKQLSCIREEDLSKLILQISRKKNCETALDSSAKQEERMLPAELKPEDFELICREYQAYLHEFQKFDFDDITILCERLLLEEEEIRHFWQEQFSYILVDEFQDISPMQYRLIRLLALPQNNLFVVGDDDQSIYGFRGASPQSMQEFLKDYPECRQICLQVNYRCHSDIIHAAVQMIAQNEERLPKEITAAHAEGKGIRYRIFPSRAEEEEFLRAELLELQKQGVLEKAALLCRTHFECTMQLRFLEQAKIPFILSEPPRSLFDHFVVQDLMTYLRLGNGNRERKNFLRIMNRPVRYLRRDSLPEETVSLSDWLSYYRNMPMLKEEIRQLFHGLERIKSMQPYLAIRYIRNVIGYDKYLRDKYIGQDLQEYLQAAEEFQEMMRPFHSFRELEAYQNSYENSVQAQRDLFHVGGKPHEAAPCGIHVMTMHASKGLEFDTVILPACEEGHIPSKKSKGEQALEEERRMLYVAMTRAKKSLLITAVKSKNGKETPSRFLDHLTCSDESSSSSSSSNSSESRYSSNASATASYSSSSSI